MGGFGTIMISHISHILSAGMLTPGASAGKPEWEPALNYIRELRRRSIFPAEPPMPFDWLDIGPGYVAGPAFGHLFATPADGDP